MASTPDMLAKLEAQRAELASDGHLRERAAAWRDATPEECLAAVEAACRDAARFLALLDPEMLERALAPEPLPPDTLALLEGLCRQRAR